MLVPDIPFLKNLVEIKWLPLGLIQSILSFADKGIFQITDLLELGLSSQKGTGRSVKL